MQIAQVLSGYSLGEADLLRRAMGKKIKEEMDKQRERFVDGAIENGVSKPQANTIFDLLAKFANYGFNKSHAAAYAIVSYQTAYMKAHYPVEFLAASMTLDMANTEKLNDFRQDAGRLGIEVVAPSVQTSFRQFETGENRIYYSLAAIKGVGEGRWSTSFRYATASRSRALRISACASIPSRSTGVCWKASSMPALSIVSAATAPN